LPDSFKECRAEGNTGARDALGAESWLDDERKKQRIKLACAS